MRFIRSARDVEAFKVRFPSNSASQQE